MPFRSKSQQRWMFSNKPEMAREWAHETPNIKKLPDKVKGASLMQKLAAAKNLRDRLVLVTKLAALQALRRCKIAAAQKLAKYAHALERGSSISKSASVAGMSFKEGAVVYSVMMDRVKKAEPGQIGSGKSVTSKVTGGALGNVSAAGPTGSAKGVANASSARPMIAAGTVPGAPQGGLNQGMNRGLAKLSGVPRGRPKVAAMPEISIGRRKEPSILPLLIALGLGGGTGALLGAGNQAHRPARGAVEGAGAGMGAVGGGLMGAGLGGLGGMAAGGGNPLAALLGAGAGGLGGAVGGGYLGQRMGKGVNNLTGGAAPGDVRDEMQAESL